MFDIVGVDEAKLSRERNFGLRMLQNYNNNEISQLFTRSLKMEDFFLLFFISLLTKEECELKDKKKWKE